MFQVGDLLRLVLNLPGKTRDNCEFMSDFFILLVDDLKADLTEANID